MEIIFIRFGEIPKDEISGIYRGDEGRVGSECGVSVFEALRVGDIAHIVLPCSETCGVNYVVEGFLDQLSCERLSCFVVTGKVVGIGSHREPCLKEVAIKNEVLLIDKQLVIR